MVFASTIFLFGFLPLVLVIYYNPIWKSLQFRNILLLLASLAFYAWGEPFFVLIMILEIILGGVIGLCLEHAKKKKVILGVGISCYVLLLFIYKYLTFLTTQLGLLLHKDFFSIKIALPIGISFFSFQLMSYLFDIYYGKAKAQKNILWVGLYVAFFPQLIAGPIVRYEQIEKEIRFRNATKEDITIGMERFIWGLGKKVLISNYVARIADNIFGFSSGVSVLTAWLGAIAYTLQIYFDFSGYSDMAIGLGRMFGFHFAENFNYPYIAKSVTDFWRRWHMSLSSWFRDYVYIPMGGNRVNKNKWIRNLLLVWVLTGIWHGANWTFLIWGLYYFCLLLLEKVTGFPQKLKAFSHIYTLIAVIIAWVIFRAEDVFTGLKYIGNMVGINAKGMIDSIFISYVVSGKIIFFFAILLSMPVYPILKKHFEKSLWFETAEAITVLTVFVLSLLVTISTTYNPFIYFNF